LSAGLKHKTNFEEFNMNDFQKAIEKNGSTMIEGVEYALVQEAYVDSFSGGVCYKAQGFSEAMLDDEGKHDPMHEETVTLIWDCNEWHESGAENDFECNWESDAAIE
jgi:hypothetical protein